MAAFVASLRALCRLSVESSRLDGNHAMHNCPRAVVSAGDELTTEADHRALLVWCRDLRRQHRSGGPGSLLLHGLSASDRRPVLGVRRCAAGSVHLPGRHPRLVLDDRRGPPRRDGTQVLLGLRLSGVQHRCDSARADLHQGGIAGRRIVGSTHGGGVDQFGAVLVAAVRARRAPRARSELAPALPPPRSEKTRSSRASGEQDRWIVAHEAV